MVWFKILVLLQLLISSVMTQERQLIVTSQQLNHPQQPSNNHHQVQGLVIASGSSQQKQQSQAPPAQQEGEPIEPDKIQSEITQQNNKQKTDHLGSLDQLPLQTQQTIKEQTEHQQASQADWAVSVNGAINQQQSNTSRQEQPTNQQEVQPTNYQIEPQQNFDEKTDNEQKSIDGAANNDQATNKGNNNNLEEQNKKEGQQKIQSGGTNEAEDNKGGVNEKDNIEPDEQKDFMNQEGFQKDDQNHNLHHQRKSINENGGQSANEEASDGNLQQKTVNRGNDRASPEGDFREVEPTTEDNENLKHTSNNIPTNHQQEINDESKSIQQNNTERDDGEKKIETLKINEQKEGEEYINKQIVSEPVAHQIIQQQQVGDDQFGDFDEGEQASQYTPQVNSFLEQLPDYSGLFNFESQ